MSRASSQPVSLVAERAVRFLRERGSPADSREMARELLATHASDESAARGVLESAFGGDPRLAYDAGVWKLTGERLESPTVTARPRRVPRRPDPDRTLILLRGETLPDTRRFELSGISVIRLQGDEVVGACGGDTVKGSPGNRLRRAVIQTLDGAIPVVHDPPGALRALENWLQEPVALPVSLRKLGQRRLGLPARHELDDFMARLRIPWRQVDDPLEQADTLDAGLRALLRKGESLQELRASLSTGPPPIDWTRYAFDRDFLRKVPKVPGTYQFFDSTGNLLYVGKSNDLNRRLSSYFRETAGSRSKRIQALLDSLYRIEYQHRGSALEATLREAELIAKRKPSKNVQRRVEPRRGRAARLQSILILEPGAPPDVLRAYLIREGRLIDSVAIGPRGGGLMRIRRVLDDWFFSAPAGPTTIAGPDLDVEIVVRWLATNRDNVVAFDPTDLRSSDEVIERLRWFLNQGGPFDTDGMPILTR